MGKSKTLEAWKEKRFNKEDKTYFPKGNWKFNNSNLQGKWKAKKSGLNTVCIIIQTAKPNYFPYLKILI